MHEGKWLVRFSLKGSKQLAGIAFEHPEIFAVLGTLISEMQAMGPIRKNWSHFGSLTNHSSAIEKCYHCHLTEGHPTYVVCWRVKENKVQIMEIYYVGTHEGAPY